MREFAPLSTEKKRELAIANLLFCTALLVGAWLVPMLTKDWHVKRWYSGLGIAGRVQLEFGLLSYDMDMSCHLFPQLCEKLDAFDQGSHSYFELTDRMCNIQHMFTSAVFRSCDSLDMLTKVSLGTFVILSVSLWCLVMGAALVILYFKGYASKKLYNWILAFYLAAPMLQAAAITLYATSTFDMRRFMDFGVIEQYRWTKIAAGSSHIVTFGFSTIGSACLVVVSTIPSLILTQCVGRDKAHWKHVEDDAWENERLLYEAATSGHYVDEGGYGRATEQGYDGYGRATGYDGYADDRGYGAPERSYY